jgi:hypothetical protein
MAGQPGFFDLSDRYEALSAAGDPLERLTTVVDFEIFRGPLVAALRRSVRAAERTSALRSGADVQDFGAAGAVLAV